MREIKFRAWNSVDKEMMYDVCLSSNGSVIAFEYGNFTGTYPKEQVIPLQYTGLRDKNGTEIYEGDIVQNEDGKISSVYFLNGMFKTRGVSLGKNSRKYEVIGNIYEHPHLLGDTDES